MPARPKHDLPVVLAAIKGSRGVKSVIADRLGVTRNTVTNYLDYWATARELYTEERGLLNDMAENVVVLALVDEDLRVSGPMARFVLQQRGSENGWQPSVKVDGKVKHDVKHSGIIAQLGLDDISNMDNEEIDDAIGKLIQVNTKLDELELPSLDGTD